MSDALFHSEIVNTKRIIYTPSEFAKMSLLNIQEVGYLQATKPHKSKRNKLISYLFFIVQSGSGTLSYEGELYNLHSGDCVFIDCKKGYYHETSDDLWKLAWVHFNGPSLSYVYDKYLERGGLSVFHPDNIEGYASIIFNLYNIASEDSYVKDMRINENLSSLLTKLMEDSWHEAKEIRSSKRQNLFEVNNYLNEHYREKISLDELAGEFYVNKFYLTRIYKEQFGVSINTYLTQLRITKAKQLLRFTDESVESIGESTGLGAIAYFSRTFKKIEGLTPSEYRNQWMRKQ